MTWSATGEQATMALRLGLFLIWAGVSMFLQLDPVNGDEQLSEDNVILPKEKKDPASGAETKDELPTETYDLPPEIYTTTFLPRTIYPQEEVPYDDKPFPSLLSKANDLNAVFEDEQLSEDYFILPKEMEDIASGAETKDQDKGVSTEPTQDGPAELPEGSVPGADTQDNQQGERMTTKEQSSATS
ncbi:hypothetical protein E5288_WYG016510 [Bos mutus]|uniref:Uncharacterized protein n=1 Tax=Bos mutus TaxID=72004 RepID=A0A6B0S568_9CETA|nr:hypothetical protein [Bos mutus]